jgi:hypothetical protein
MSFRLLKYHKIKEDQAFDNSTIAKLIQGLALLFDEVTEFLTNLTRNFPKDYNS